MSEGLTMNDRLTNLRFALGLDWGGLARRLGIGRSMLGFVRKGTKGVSAKLGRRILDLEEESRTGNRNRTDRPSLSERMADGDGLIIAHGYGRLEGTVLSAVAAHAVEVGRLLATARPTGEDYGRVIAASHAVNCAIMAWRFAGHEPEY